MNSSISHFDNPEFYGYLGGGYIADSNLEHRSKRGEAAPASLDDCLKKLSTLIEAENGAIDAAAEKSNPPLIDEAAVTAEFAQLLDDIAASADSADFAKALRAAPPSDNDKQETKENRAAIYKRKPLVEILRKLSDDPYLPEQSEIRNRLKNLVNVIGGEKPDTIEENDFLNVKEWSYVSLVLDQIVKDWQSALDKELISLAEHHTNNARILRISENIQKQNKSLWENFMGVFFSKDDSCQEMQSVIETDAKARLDQLSKQSDKNRYSQSSLQVLRDIQNICLLESEYLAQMHVIPEIAQTDEATWTLGYSSTTTISAFLGAASPGSIVGPSIGANANYAHDNMRYMDDEGNKCRLEHHSVGLTVEGKFSFFGLAEGAASAGGQVVVKGDYAEFITPQTYATVDFDRHIKEREHRTNPRIAPYLSRTRLLCESHHVREVISPELKAQLQTIAKDEIVDLDTLKAKFDLNREKMERRIKLYMAKKLDVTPYVKTAQLLIEDHPTLDKKALPFFRETDVVPDSKMPAYALNSINAPDRTFGVIPAGVSCVLGKASVSASSGLGDGLGAIKIGKKPGDDIFSAGASLSGQVRSRTLTVNKRTPLLDRYTDPFKIGRKVNPDADSWWSWGDDTNLVDENQHIKTQIDERFNSIEKDIEDALGIKLPSTDVERVKYIEMLKMYYDEYKSLHADVAAGKLKNSKGDNINELLRNFEKRFNASTPEQLLHRWVITNAYMFMNLGPCVTSATDEQKLIDAEQQFLTAKQEVTQAKRQILEVQHLLHEAERLHIKHQVLFFNVESPSPKTSPQLDEAKQQLSQAERQLCEAEERLLNAKLPFIKNRMKAFEKELLAPPFTVDKNYLKERCYFVEDIDFRGIEVKFEAKGHASASVLVDAEGSIELKGSYRHQTHTGILRRGEYIDLAFVVGGTIGDVNTAVQSMAGTFFDNMPLDAATAALAELETALKIIGLTASVSIKRAYILRIARPSKLCDDSEKFSFSRYFFRVADDEVIEAGFSAAIPTGFFDITAGAKYRKNVMTPKSEDMYATTFHYFIELYLNGKNRFDIDRKTGKVNDKSNWKRRMETQEEVLKALFIDYAKEGPSGKLHQELVEYKKAIGRNNVLKNKTVLATFRDSDTSIEDEFIGAQRHFARKASEYYAAVKANKNADAVYVEAREAFERVLHPVHPLWFEQRTNSSLLRPKKLALVE